MVIKINIYKKYNNSNSKGKKNSFVSQILFFIFMYFFYLQNMFFYYNVLYIKLKGIKINIYKK